MIEIVSIQEYVQKTANIISSVLEMEILVCDQNMRLLADSEEEVEEFSYINPESILTSAIERKETIVVEKRETDSAGCLICKSNLHCPVLSIIAIPILRNEKVIGAIGIYANSRESKQKLILKREFFIGFISNMSELIISKLEEKEENIELKAFQEKFSMIVESIDIPILGIDENRKIIHCNNRFKKLFRISENYSRDQILKIMSNPGFAEYISNCNLGEEMEFNFNIKGSEMDIIVATDIIKVNDVFKGAIFYFKKKMDLYDEVNRVTNNFVQFSMDEIIGNSFGVRKLKSEIIEFAKSNSTILIQGESGTGKGLVARAIHCNSMNSKGPFVVVNCAAIPENLLESELFGHEEGAFTGSMKGGKIGKFELANKGTLFLDEVGEIPIHLQAKLLRAVQEKKIERVGSGKEISVDIRIITATNRDLEEMMKVGEFREDLFYRLNVIPMLITPLRERSEDIRLMLKYFINKYSEILNKNIDGMQKEAEQRLLAYQWPGNIRELQNVVEYAVNFTRNTWISENDLPKRIINSEVMKSVTTIIPLNEVEKFYINEAIRIYGNDLIGKERAAKELGISRATLYRKLK
ncbi:MAG: sigma 54-interacting transcriptional regulator [Proteocatella sp.]